MNAPNWRDALEAGDSADTAGSRAYTNRTVAAMIRDARSPLVGALAAYAKARGVSA